MSSGNNGTGAGEPEREPSRGKRPRAGHGCRRSEEDQDEELRLAVVLNGGASLAVWMGGVVTEIHELTSGGTPVPGPRDARSGGEVYDEVLRLLGTTARVDVIAGTSAGGINGAFLALGQVYPQADLSTLQQLWADRGSLETLLHNPVRGRHHSLLRGDDYFLPELRNAFDGLVAAGNPSTRSGRPVDLFLTCTLLNGQHQSFVDSVGQGLWEVRHTGLLTFSRTPEDLDPRDEAPNRPGGPLAEPHTDDFDGDISYRLALAARATASFPGAFEPVFLPVLDRETVRETCYGPPESWSEVNLRDHANFSDSRYAIDGGVLCNQPIEPALRAIHRKPADLPVRRMLLYVNPDPSGQSSIAPDRVDDLPPLRDILLASLTRLTIGQNVFEELAEIDRMNHQAEVSQDSWPQLVAALPDQLPAERFAEVFRRYRDWRVREESRRTGAAIAEAWLRDRLRDLDGGPAPEAVGQQRRLQERVKEGIARQHPWSTRGPRADETGRAAADQAQHWLIEPEGPGEEPSWRWGTQPLERLAVFVLHQITRAQRLPPLRRHEARQLREELRSAKSDVHLVLTRMRAYRWVEHEYWSQWVMDHRDLLRAIALDSPGAPEPGPLLDEACDGLRARFRHEVSRGALEGPTQTVPAVIRSLNAVAAVVADPDLAACPEGREMAGTLRSLGLLEQDQHLAQDGHRLFLAEIYVTLAGVAEPDHRKNPLELVLLSSHTNPSWAHSSTTPQGKIAGLKLGHFGAFYKRSWRVNDWLWGRVDASTRLMQALLDPRRLAQRGVTVEDILAALQTVGWEAEELDRNLALAAELDEYRKWTPQDGPERLPVIAELFATARHWRIITRTSLEDLNDATRFDVAQGANPHVPDLRPATSVRIGHGGAPLPEEQAASAASNTDTSRDAARRLRAFDEARIGAQTWDSEAGTDLYSRLVALGLANLTAMARSASTGSGPLRAVVPALHGVALLLYSLVVSASKGRTGASLVNLALASGGAFIAVGLLDPSGYSSTLLQVGGTVTLMGICAAALRSSVGILALVGAPVTLFAILLLVLDTGHASGVSTTVLVVLGAVAAAWSLGMLREPRRTPSWYHARRVLGAGTVLAGIAALCAVLWLACRGLCEAAGIGQHQQDPPLRRWLRDEIPLSAWGCVSVLAILLSAVLSWYFGRRTRPVPGSGTVEHAERHYRVRWFPWYGVVFAAIFLADLAFLSRLPASEQTPAWSVSIGLSSVLSWLALVFLLPVGAMVRRPEVVPSAISHERKASHH